MRKLTGQIAALALQPHTHSRPMIWFKGEKVHDMFSWPS